VNQHSFSILGNGYDRVRQRLQRHLESLAGLELNTIKIGVAAAGAVALALAIRETIEILRLNSAESPWAIEISCGYLCPKVRIATAMILTASCLLSLSPTRFLISILPLGWVVAEHVFWLSRSLKVKQYYDSLGVYRWPQGRTLGFVGATWWDIPVMLVTALVLVWWTITLCSALFWPHLGRARGQPCLP